MRIVNRALAFLLAVALLAASVILIIEVIARGLDQSPIVVHWDTWQHWADTTTWNRKVIKSWSIVLIVVGAILFIAELKPSRKGRLILASQSHATQVAITAKGLADTLDAVATEVEGVRSASVDASPRKVRVKVTTAASDKAGAEALRGPLTDAIQARIDGLSLQRPPRLSVRVSSRGR